MESPQPLESEPVLVPGYRSMLCPQLVMTGRVGVRTSARQWTSRVSLGVGEKASGLRV